MKNHWQSHLHSVTFCGSSFQSLGADTLKARSPADFLWDRGTTNFPLLSDLSVLLGS